jgi:hypothetical protein
MLRNGKHELNSCKLRNLNAPGTISFLKAVCTSYCVVDINTLGRRWKEKENREKLFPINEVHHQKLTATQAVYCRS